MDPDAVAKAFMQHYYQTFDFNRAALEGLYQDGSMLTFEGEKFLGGAAIAGKIGSLPFQQCQHKIDTVDCQPSGPQGGILFFVSGTITLGPNEHPLKFSQGNLRTYMYCNNVWTFILRDVKFTNEEMSANIGKVKIVACNSDLMKPEVPPQQ